MKNRPRRVEREVAVYLSHHYFCPRGLRCVERIPVLGRTGPDLQINESELVIDVKSRLEVPKVIFKGERVLIGELVGVPLKDLDLLKSGAGLDVGHSKMIQRWWEHMDEWRRVHHPMGVSALVLHRPRMRIANSVFVVRKDDISRIGGGLL